MKTQKQQGFTIIEVVLVLAIAGLIFLVVFLAVPALQRSQRDTARRNDVGKVVSSVQSWRTDHKGQLPAATDWNAAFKTSYLAPAGDTFEDPQAGPYTLAVATSTTQVPTRNATTAQILVHPGHVCDASGNATVTNAGARNVAVRINLESGSAYCQSN